MTPTSLKELYNLYGLAALFSRAVVSMLHRRVAQLEAEKQLLQERLDAAEEELTQSTPWSEYKELQQRVFNKENVPSAKPLETSPLKPTRKHQSSIKRAIAKRMKTENNYVRMAEEAQRVSDAVAVERHLDESGFLEHAQNIIQEANQ